MGRDRESAFLPLPSGSRFVDLVVTIDQRDNPQERHARTRGKHNLWQGRFRLQVAAVETIEQAMASISDTRVGAAIKRSFVASWSTRGREDSGRVLGLIVGGEDSRYPELSGIAVSLNVHLRRNEVPVVSTKLVASAATRWTNFSEGLRGYCRFDPTPSELAAVDADLHGWDLQVIGEPYGALGIWEADRRWKGEFSIPLAEALERVVKR